ncbi:MAG: hypothetical protein FH748_08310 [Balneolaceae bacterium]|nr:hypothetical protein [Balneolaceae bacterium]
MEFRGKQKICYYTQLNYGSRDDVFPLLCPVREKDWLDGWDFTMIHSESGLIEQDCVFTTPHHGEFETTWHVTQHDSKEYLIEFLRVTPRENVVRINITLHKVAENETEVHISYQYTALTEEQNHFIKNELEHSFEESMHWWEQAINHYLETGKMLRK